jgi:hypothetical protein
MISACPAGVSGRHASASNAEQGAPQNCNFIPYIPSISKVIASSILSLHYEGKN